MLNKKLIKIINSKNIIVDFDGVLTKINTDWPATRIEISKALGLEKTLDITRLFLYSTIKNKRGEYLKIIRRKENNGLNYNVKSELFDFLKINKVKVDIVSNNSSKTIYKFLLHEKFLSHCKKIVSAENVKYLKPNSEGILKALTKQPSQYCYIGNTLDDELAAKGAKVNFYKYEFKSS